MPSFDGHDAQGGDSAFVGRGLEIDPLDDALLTARIEARLFSRPPEVAIDRYRIVELVGRGGGGSVYRARDPQLDRPVAIKIVRTGAPSPSRGEGAHSFVDAAEVREEARTLARVSHPNVVEVFDVFATTDRPGIAIVMQWVEGSSLQTWLTDRPRTLEARLALLTGTARGLAAIHRAGLVHRDFKPGNVLIDASGTPKVADFGLATVVHTATGTLPMTRQPDVARVVGTPAYMAPEQLRGGAVDRRADVYSYCVTAFETLVGRLPAQVAQVAQADGAERAQMLVLRERGLSRGAARAIIRGLRPDPSARPRSIDVVLRRLTTQSSPTRRLSIMVGAAACAGWVAWAASSSTPTPTCEESIEASSDGWATRMARFEGDEAKSTDASARVRVERFLEQWSTAHTRACEAQAEAAVSGTLQLRCLARLERELIHLLNRLHRVEQSTEAPRRLPLEALRSPDSCLDHPQLLGWTPVDEASAARSEGFFERRAEALALARMGLVEEARVRFAALEREAEQLRSPQARLLVLMHQGRLLSRLGAHEEAAEQLAEAYDLAGQGGHGMELALIATDSTYLVGYELHRAEEGRTWARHAEAALERAGLTGPWRAALASHRGSIEAAVGRFDEAVKHHQEALRIRRERQGESPELLASTLNNLGNLEMRRGNYDAALPYHEEAVAIRRAHLDADAPRLAASLNNLGGLYMVLGDHVRARETLTEALELLEHPSIRRHRDIVHVLVNLSSMALEAFDAPTARLHAERAVRIADAHLQSDHPSNALAHEQLGAALLADGSARAALDELALAHTAYLAAWGPRHADVGAVLNEMGLARRELGQHGRAAEHFAAAKEVWLEVLGPQHPNTLIVTTNLALERLEARNFVGARRDLTAVLDSSGFSALPPNRRGAAQFGLARALWPERAQRPRALELAQAAAAHLVDDPVGARDEVAAWLKARR